MTLKTIKNRIAFTLIASLPAAASLKASTVPAPVSGDLYLGFRSTSEPGSAIAYIVKLGQDTTFLNASAGTSFTVSGLGNIASDLQEQYGPNWSTRSDLFWGVFGVRPDVDPTLYASRKRSVVANPAAAWSTLTLTARNSTKSQIVSVLQSLGGYQGCTATANSPVATIQENTIDSSSYNKQVATAGVTDFGTVSKWTAIEGDFTGGVAASALDLFQVSSGGVARVGKFSISAGGAVQFTAPSAAAPIDTDGDGFLDSEETLAGTSPTNPSDFFRVQSVELTATGPGVTFNTIPSRSYKVYYTQDLISGWTLIDTVAAGASPASFQYIDTDLVRKSRPTGFYKVAVTQ